MHLKKMGRIRVEGRSDGMEGDMAKIVSGDKHGIRCDRWGWQGSVVYSGGVKGTRETEERRGLGLVFRLEMGYELGGGWEREHGLPRSRGRWQESCMVWGWQRRVS